MVKRSSLYDEDLHSVALNSDTARALDFSFKKIDPVTKNSKALRLMIRKVTQEEVEQVMVCAHK